MLKEQCLHDCFSSTFFRPQLLHTYMQTVEFFDIRTHEVSRMTIAREVRDMMLNE